VDRKSQLTIFAAIQTDDHLGLSLDDIRRRDQAESCWMMVVLLRAILGWLSIDYSWSLAVEIRRSSLRPWKGDGPILGWCEEKRGREENILEVLVGWNSVNVDRNGDNDNEDVLKLSLPGPRIGGVSASLWPAGIAASILMLSPKFRSAAKGKDVLELGSGLGLTGMTAAIGCSKIILTDNDEETVELLKVSLERNSDAMEAEGVARNLDWRDTPVGDDLTPVDIIVGSDVAYYFPLLRPIMDTTRRFLVKPSSLLFLAGQGNRESQWDLYKNIREGSYNQLTDEKEPPWPGQTKMLLYKLDMSEWREDRSEADAPSPEFRDGFFPIVFLVHSNEFDLGPFTTYDYVATQEDNDVIFKSF
jgi:Lysine methyltransferase